MDWKYEDGRIYSVDESNELMAEVTFAFKANGDINIDRTYVNPVLRGKGVAGKLMEVVVQYLRENKLKATATCSYANAWLKRHRKSHADIIAETIDDDDIGCKIGGKQ